MCIKLIIVLIFFAQIECMENTEISKTQELGKHQTERLWLQSDFESKPFNTVPDDILTGALRFYVGDHLRIIKTDKIETIEARVKPLACLRAVCKKWREIFDAKLVDDIGSDVEYVDKDWVKAMYIIPTRFMFNYFVKKEVDSQSKNSVPKLGLDLTLEQAMSTVEIIKSKYKSLITFKHKDWPTASFNPSQFYPISKSLVDGKLIIQVDEIIRASECWAHSCSIIKLFIDNGARKLGEDLQWLLRLKCTEGNVDDIRDLLDCGLTIFYSENRSGYPNYNWSSICNLEKSQAKRIITMLVEKGVDFNKNMGSSSCSLFEDACWENKPDIVEILLDKGYSLDSNNSYFFPHLAAHNACGVMKLLLEKRGFELKKREGMCEPTPLHYAIRYACYDMVKYLVARGESVNEMGSYDNEKHSVLPLTNARWRARSIYFGETEEKTLCRNHIVEFLVENGAIDDSEEELIHNEVNDSKKKTINNRESLIMRFVGLIERASTGDLGAMVMLFGGAAILGLVYGELRNWIADAIFSYPKTSPIPTE